MILDILASALGALIIGGAGYLVYKAFKNII